VVEVDFISRDTHANTTVLNWMGRPGWVAYPPGDANAMQWMISEVRRSPDGRAESIDVPMDGRPGGRPRQLGERDGLTVSGVHGPPSSQSHPSNLWPSPPNLWPFTRRHQINFLVILAQKLR
jgi:hypothetical protein